MRMDELNDQVRELVAKNLPSIQVIRVDSEPILDTGGDESLDIKVVINSRPGKDQATKYSEVVDQLRTWLAGRDDERFPYVDFITEQEERELQKAD